jgi:hypothetical protein
MALDQQASLKELDINPLFVLPAGKGVRAGDALARCMPHAADAVNGVGTADDLHESEHCAPAVVDG